MHKDTQNEAVCLIKQKSRESFNYLYANYSEFLWVVILLSIKDMDKSEDVLKDTFIEIWLNIDDYDQEKDHLYSWMRNIAVNKAMNITVGEKPINHVIKTVLPDISP